MTAYEIQKQRIQEIEEKATALLEQCSVVTLASVNAAGYPRICAINKLNAQDFHDLYFISSKRSQLNGKVTHFESNSKASVCYTLGGDSVTLIGEISFVTDPALKAQLWNEDDRKFFSKGLSDPKLRMLHFHTLEATFWIQGSFRTCSYK